MTQQFAQIIGNDPIKQYLTKMVEQKAIAHSLLFAGPNGIGKSLFAEAFAKLLLNIDGLSHPDIRIYRPEGKIGMHSMESMRQFSKEVYMPPYESPWKVFILHDAERMLTYSANALLKTFEEPSKQSIIILLSSHPEALLPTLLSRCRMVRFCPLSTDEIALFLQEKYAKTEAEAQLIASQTQGSVGTAVRLVETGGDPLRTSILSLLSRGRMSTYTQVMEAAQSISSSMEEQQKKTEEAVRAEQQTFYPDGLTSIQQQTIDKEIDGILALELAQEADRVFDLILSWYRDMHLLYVRGNPAYTCHLDFQEQNKQAFQKGEIMPLESVQAAISHARLTLARSTPLNNCLENLFLHLNMI